MADCSKTSLGISAKLVFFEKCLPTGVVFLKMLLVLDLLSRSSDVVFGGECLDPDVKHIVMTTASIVDAIMATKVGEMFAAMAGK